MRSVRFVCLFVIFVSAMLAAQSQPVPSINQPNALSSVQQIINRTPCRVFNKNIRCRPQISSQCRKGRLSPSARYERSRRL
jgi:hypothetical protein